LDLYANKTIHFSGLDPQMVPLGIAVQIPRMHFGILALRSSLGKKGIFQPNGVGIIDADYRGEINCLVWSMKRFTISKGDRIAQLIVVPYREMIPMLFTKLSDTKRGTGGFGSTGKR